MPGLSTPILYFSVKLAAMCIEVSSRPLPFTLKFTFTVFLLLGKNPIHLDATVLHICPLIAAFVLQILRQPPLHLLNSYVAGKLIFSQISILYSTAPSPSPLPQRFSDVCP